jgi:hypothetical protein
MTTPRKSYESPKLVVLGTLHELTLQEKFGGACDVTCFHNTSGSH